MNSQVTTIYRDMRRALGEAEYEADQALPSLRRLAGRYDCSVGTVRAALSKLQAEGLVEARHGSGFYAVGRDGSLPRTVLLIARTTGDTWSDFMRLFCERLAGSPDVDMLTMAPPSEDDVDSFRQKVDRMLRNGLDAIIFDGSVGLNLHFLAAYQDRTRLICYNDDYICQDWRCARVMTDYFHGGYAGLRHLLDEGARHVVFLVPHTFHLAHGRDQQRVFAGCRQAIADVPEDVRVDLLPLNVNDETFAAKVDQWLAAHETVDGIYSFCDFRLEHVIPILKRRGLSIPGRMRLLGYFDTPWCQVLSPILSSVNIQPAAIVDQVLQALESGGSPQVLVKPVVVPRASSRLAVGAAASSRIDVDSVLPVGHPA